MSTVGGTPLRLPFSGFADSAPDTTLTLQDAPSFHTVQVPLLLSDCSQEPQPIANYFDNQHLTTGQVVSSPFSDTSICMQLERGGALVQGTMRNTGVTVEMIEPHLADPHVSDQLQAAMSFSGILNMPPEIEIQSPSKRTVGASSDIGQHLNKREPGGQKEITTEVLLLDVNSEWPEEVHTTSTVDPQVDGDTMLEIISNASDADSEHRDETNLASFKFVSSNKVDSFDSER